MESTSSIQDTYQSVSTFSFESKKEVLSEENVNRLLDAIISLKKWMVERKEKIEGINKALEGFTWLGALDDKELKQMNDLIAACKDLHGTLIRNYTAMGYLRTKGVAKEEIKGYKLAIDDLKEAYQDLESAFFFLPQTEGFKEVTKKLSGI